MAKNGKNGSEKTKNHAVFMTLYSFDGGHYFGLVLNGEMRLNQAGEMAAQWAMILADEFGVKVSGFVVMPNHMHLLLQINDLPLNEAEFDKQLTQMMEWFMTITTREYHSAASKHNMIPVNGDLWRKDFSHHVLKNEKEIEKARQYISDNPRKWHLDSENTGSSTRPV